MHQSDGHMFACFSICSVAFSRLLAQIIRLHEQFPDSPIQSTRMDNAGEFSSQTFLLLLHVNWN
jgi:hypothetical protein